MEQILKTVIDIGLNKTVKVLHITDAHLVDGDENDKGYLIDLLKMRKETFIKEGKYPPKTQNEYLVEAFELAENEGAYPVLTGDIMDLNTSGNRREMHRICDGREYMFTAGTHEFQRSSCTPKCCPLEEPFPYYRDTRNALMAEFPQWKLDSDSRVIGGVNLITVDNSQGFFTEPTFESLKREAEKGLPMVLFMHIPLNDERLRRPPQEGFLMSREEFDISEETLSFIKSCPLIKATFAGHWHCDSRYPDMTPPSYVTPGLFSGICRMIEIK